MMMRKLLAVVAMLALPAMVQAQADESRRFILFNGANTDTNEQASPWINVRGARRILIRTWSTHAAFTMVGADTCNGGFLLAATDVDSIYTDSLSTFRAIFSDSLESTISDFNGSASPLARDSIVVDIAVATSDTSKVGIKGYPHPITKALRGPTNGWGIVTTIYPVAATLGAPDYSGHIPKGYMRIRVTPTTRLTVCGGQSTAGKRTAGLKGLNMVAYVYYGP